MLFLVHINIIKFLVILERVICIININDNSNNDANIEIAGAMLRNLHRNYNITKKTDNEIRSDSDK